MLVDSVLIRDTNKSVIWNFAVLISFSYIKFKNYETESLKVCFIFSRNLMELNI